MSQGNAGGPLISAAWGGQVTLATAARELGLAWAAADDEARRAGGEGMLRLRELNLVIHTASKTDAGSARAAAARLVREHSGRVILLAPPGEATSRRDRQGAGTPALISTECFVEQQSGRQVCSEFVIIGATGEEGRAARAAVVGLLVPDLPVIGWWSGGFSPADPTLLWLAELSDQLVVDSDRAGHPGIGDKPPAHPGPGVQASAGLARMAPETAVRDLAWLRVAPWRSLTAELFDGADRRHLIPHINRLRLEHQGSAAQALLYSAWFGSRLGLSTIGGGRRRKGSLSLTLRRLPGADEPARAPASMAIETHLLSTENDDVPGLRRVSMYADSSGPRARPVISMGRRPRSYVLTAYVADGEGKTMVKSLGISSDDEWRLLSHIVETPGPDSVYEETVGVAAAICASLAAGPGSRLDGGPTPG